MKTITVNKLAKTYITHKRKEGFFSAIKSLFNREKVVAHAVDKISFSVNEGEIVGFVGQNGAGKSTTIKMLTGVLHPTSGEVSVLGFTPWRERKKYVANIGVVFGQKTQLWLDLPPIDAFYLNKDIYKIPEEVFKKRLAVMTTLLGVEEVMKRPTRNLSLGERMKCEFIMALLHNPRVLFLDEPTIGVDAIAKDEIRQFLIEMNKKYKTTIILTTHDMDDIEALCKRIVIIDEGKLIYDGDLKVVKEKYVRWKTVDFDFVTVHDEKKLDRVLLLGDVQENRERFKSVRFNKEKVPIAQVIKDIMEACEVVDLAVHEPRLEHVIKEIYKDRKA